MRNSIFWVIAIFSLASSCTIFKRSANSELGIRFKDNFSVLDSVVNENPTKNKYFNCPMQIDFMEEYTGIPADGDGTLIGRIWFSKKTWEAWHRWYNKHYRK